MAAGRTDADSVAALGIPGRAAALKKLASTWQINVIEDRNGWIAGHYAISSIPHLFIIGRDGKVLAIHVGYGDCSLEELLNDISQALSKATPGEWEVSPSATDST